MKLCIKKNKAIYQSKREKNKKWNEYKIKL